MKTSVRWYSRFAFAAGVGLTALVACSSDQRPPSEEVARTGTLGLALESTAASGTTYRLRNATFIITNAHTGDTVDFLFSEDAPPSARELRKVLVTGNYTITLLDGWFMERVSGGSSGSGASSGTAGSSGKGGSVGGGGRSGGKGGTSSVGGFAGEFEQGGQGDSSEAGSFGTGGSSAGSGPIGEGGNGAVGNGETEVVDAFLLSDAVQFFQLFGNDETFVLYQFQIGGEEVDFGHGRLIVGIDVIEDPSVCQSPEGVLDPRKVLLETNLDAVANITLFDVLGALASNGGMEADPLLIYQRIYDSYASPENASIADAVHCGDEMTDGVPTLNGYPIECDRIEAAHVNDPDGFFATAIVNRMDLAPENGAHCGQQRVIFANNDINRAFMIFEAQIPNPAPELGIAGCRPLAEFWLAQNDIADPSERGARLAQAFLSGAPELVEQGFGAFYTATNLTVGSGQIRTNQFDQDPWTLREFKLALDGQNLTPVPFPTSESPNGALWNENSGLPQGPACRDSFLAAVDQLLTDDPSEMSFVVDNACKDAESRNDFSQDYASQLSDGFRAVLEERLADTGLSADDIANRAQFAGSCIGCHEEATGRFLGNFVFAPFSNGFVHIDESFPVDCGKNDVGLCFQPSPALMEVFLPSRLQVLGRVLDIPIIVDPCGPNGGSGGFAGSGSAGFGGTFSGAGGSGASGGRSGGKGGTTGNMSGGGTDAGAPSTPPSMAEPPTPAPEVNIELPSADEPVEDMQEDDEAIREVYGELTLSGRSAQSTH